MHSIYLGYCAPHVSLQFKLNSFFSCAPFSPGIHNGRERKKLSNSCLN